MGKAAQVTDEDIVNDDELNEHDIALQTALGIIDGDSDDETTDSAPATDDHVEDDQDELENDDDTGEVEDDIVDEIGDDIEDKDVEDIDEDEPSHLSGDTETKETRPINQEKVQKRINKAVRKQREAEEETAILRQQLAEQNVVVKPALTEVPKMPQLNDEDVSFDQGILDTKMSEYHRSMAEISLKGAREKDDLDRQISVEQSAYTEMSDNYFDKVDIFTDKTPDFEKVTSKLPFKQGEVSSTIMEMDNGPEVAYYLGKNLDIAEKINKMTPMQAAVKLGGIASRLRKPTVRKSNAPKPVKRQVKGAGVTGGDAFQKSCPGAEVI